MGSSLGIVVALVIIMLASLIGFCAAVFTGKVQDSDTQKLRKRLMIVAATSAVTFLGVILSLFLLPDPPPPTAGGQDPQIDNNGNPLVTVQFRRLQDGDSFRILKHDDSTGVYSKTRVKIWEGKQDGAPDYDRYEPVMADVHDIHADGVENLDVRFSSLNLDRTKSWVLIFSGQYSYANSKNQISKNLKFQQRVLRYKP